MWPTFCLLSSIAVLQVRCFYFRIVSCRIVFQYFWGSPGQDCRKLCLGGLVYSNIRAVHKLRQIIFGRYPQFSLQTNHVLRAYNQSRKNPVSVSAMLTRKFLQIRKVFATSSLLAEEFPDTLQYKISR